MFSTEYCNINTDNYAEGQDQILTNFNQSHHIKSIEDTRVLLNDHNYCNLNLKEENTLNIFV